MLVLSDKSSGSTPHLKWARSATKHRIARERSRFVVEHSDLRFEKEHPAGATPRILFLGDDANGVALEVMAIELEEDSLLVIHAMQLRGRYRKQYEEAKQWRR